MQQLGHANGVPGVVMLHCRPVYAVFRVRLEPCRETDG